MLYNIAQAYRLNDQPGEALRFYRRYLQRAPNARNREDVERKIAELEKSVEDKRKAAAAVAPPPVTAPAPVAPAPAPTPPVAVSPPPAPTPPANEASGATPATQGTPPPAPEEPSVARKVVSWVLVGVGAGALVGGGIAGIIAKQKSDSVSNMSKSDPSVEFDPTVEHSGMVANDWFIGLGIAGVACAATGVVLLLTGGSSAEGAPAAAPPATARATFAPWLGAGIVGAGADLRF
jgi:hypothetical protein